MVYINLIAILAVAVTITATPVVNETHLGTSCTITQWSEVSSVVSSCKNIFINNLHVPAGKTLELNLKSGTTLTFQGTTTFDHLEWVGPLIEVKGNNIHVNGASGSILDGRGVKYWDGKGDKGKKKPKFFRIHATGGSTLKNIHLLNCPHQCVSIQNSKQLTLSGWNIDVSAGDINQLGHNTDGFDISKSEEITIDNCNIKNQDDCVAVNSGKNYHFSKLHCSGGHGLSLSVGQSKTDSSENYAQNITFSDCTVANSRNGIHIKTHTDAAKGYINGVIFKNIKLSGITHYGINVQEDYKSGSGTGHPGNNIPITGLTIQGVTGSMTTSNAMAVYILCGSSGCSNFPWSSISISGGHKSNSCNFRPTGFHC